MTVVELLRQMREKEPSVFQGLSDAQAEALVSGLFEQINSTLSRIDEGVVKFPGFGQFRIRKVKKDIDGKVVERTHTVFRPAAGERRGRGGSGQEDGLERT